MWSNFKLLIRFLKIKLTYTNWNERVVYGACYFEDICVKVTQHNSGIESEKILYLFFECEHKGSQR
jgi:hypothetical protein